MLRYLFVLLAFSSASIAAEIETSYTEVLRKQQLAARCGLQINSNTEAWIQNLQKFLSKGEVEVSSESASAYVDVLLSQNPVQICIQVRARLFEDGWL
jgi:hypothetical protein